MIFKFYLFTYWHMNRWYCCSLQTAIFNKTNIWGNKFDATIHTVAMTHSGEIQRHHNKRGRNTPGAGRTLSQDFLNVMLKWQEREMKPSFVNTNGYNKQKCVNQKKIICGLNLQQHARWTLNLSPAFFSCMMTLKEKLGDFGQQSEINQVKLSDPLSRSSIELKERYPFVPILDSSTRFLKIVNLICYYKYFLFFFLCKAREVGEKVAWPNNHLLANIHQLMPLIQEK